MKRTNTGVDGALTTSRRKMLGFAGTFAAAALSLGLAVGVPAMAANAASSANDDAAATASTGGTGSATNADTDSATLAQDVAAKASPSVGTVTAAISTPETQGMAMGSCVLIDDQGNILTNYHVI